MKAFSKIIASRAITLMGHIMRAEESDQMKMGAINAEYARVERQKRRVGRPRFYWLQKTMEKADHLARKRRGDEQIVFEESYSNDETGTFIVSVARVWP